jgi:carbamoyl-phosphate synthase large subunit
MEGNMRDLTVLVTACGVQFIPGLIKCLRNNGERNIKIVGTDMFEDPTLYEFVDVLYKVPEASSPNYVERLLEICKKEKVDVLLPFMSSELLSLHDNKVHFERIGTKVSVSNRNSIEIANNKLKFYEYLRDHGLSVPKFYPLRNADELEEVCIKLGFPEKAVCVKATNLSGSRGIRIIDPSKSRSDILFGEKPNSFYISLEELKIILSEKNTIPEMMAMEYLPGEEYSVDLIADDGKVIYMCGRESNVILASIPQVATLQKNEEAYNISCSVIEALRLDGNADLDFKFNELGQPVLMEVNPRIAATLGIFEAGGLNLPYLRIKQLLGEELPEVNIKYGMMMKRRYLESFAMRVE